MTNTDGIAHIQAIGNRVESVLWYGDPEFSDEMIRAYLRRRGQAKLNRTLDVDRCSILRVMPDDRG